MIKDIIIHEKKRPRDHLARPLSFPFHNARHSPDALLHTALDRKTLTLPTGWEMLSRA